MCVCQRLRIRDGFIQRDLVNRKQWAFVTEKAWRQTGNKEIRPEEAEGEKHSGSLDA